MMNAVNMLVKDTPDPAASAKGRKDSASASDKGGFSRELKDVNGRRNHADAVHQKADDQDEPDTLQTANADTTADDDTASTTTAVEAAARKLAARTLRLTREATTANPADQTDSKTPTDGTDVDAKLAEAKTGKRAALEAVIGAKKTNAAEAGDKVATDEPAKSVNASRKEMAAKLENLTNAKATPDADVAATDATAQAEQAQTASDPSLGDVLGILAATGSLSPKARDAADWRDTRDASKVGSVDGAGAAKAVSHGGGNQPDDDADAVETNPTETTDRTFRLQRGEGRGQSVDLKISTDAEGRTETEARLPGQGKAETVNVLESRRYLGFDTPSNSASLTSALAGDGDWAVAMQPGSRLANEAQVSSTGQVVNTLKLQMTPESLGTVTAMLRLSGEELSVHLTVHNAAAYRELKDDASAMLDALRSQGFSVDQVTVGMASSSAQSQAGSDGNAQYSQQSAQQMAGEGQRNGERGNRQGSERGFLVDDRAVTGGSDDVETADAAVRTSGGARPGHVYL